MAKPHPSLIELAANRPLPRQFEDPARLLRSAIEHRMHGLLYSRLLKGDVELPLSGERRLAALDLGTQAHHQKLWAALEEISTKLHEEGFEIAVFKGVIAEHLWYERFGERPSRDLDLWLSPSQLDKVDEVVRLLAPRHPLSGCLNDLVHTGHLQSIDLFSGGVWVDLHLDPFKMGVWAHDLDGAWERIEQTEVGVRTLDEATAAVQLLLHLNKDRFSWLLGLVDIERLLRDQPRRSNQAQMLAQGEGLGALVSASASAVSRLLRIRIPMDPPEGWRAYAWKVIWPDSVLCDGDAGFARGRRRQFLAPFLSEDRLIEGLVFLARRVLPPQELVDYYFPDRHGPYLRRLISGRTRKGISTLLARIGVAPRRIGERW